MKKTKLIAIFVAVMAVTTLTSLALAGDAPSDRQTLYAPDGREIVVSVSEAEDYVNVGWYTFPVTTIYAPDGREIVVSFSEAESYKKVGWYTEPVITMYAPDGRETVALKSEISSYTGVGWYTEPVVPMYAPDGRVQYILTSQTQSYNSVGWYYEPVQKLCAPDGRETVVPKTQVEAYKKVGWLLPDDYILFLADYTCEQSGYNSAVLFLENYTTPGREKYVSDYARRLKFKNKLNEIKYRWLTEIGSPIGATGWHMTEDENGSPRVNVEFRNLTDETVVGFEAEWTCYDISGQIATDYPGVHNGVVTAWADGKEFLPGETKTFTWTLTGNSQTNSISWPYLKKAAFAGGTIWQR